MRILLPPELSAWLAARIANYLAEASELYHRWEAQAVTEFAALPLIRHWFETFGLRADGTVVRWSTEGNDRYPGMRAVEERYDWLTALVEGARRWPELGVLLPVRPPIARDCVCVRHPGFAPGKALCPECCGLRWVVPDAEPTALPDPTCIGPVQIPQPP